MFFECYCSISRCKMRPLSRAIKALSLHCVQTTDAHNQNIATDVLSATTGWYTYADGHSRDAPVPGSCSCPPRTLRLVSIPPYRPRRLPRCPGVAGSGQRGKSRDGDQKAGAERGWDAYMRTAGITTNHLAKAIPVYTCAQSHGAQE